MRGKRPPTAKIERVGGYLEFVTRDRRYDQQSKTGGGRSKSSETIMEENVKLTLDGFVYHPNFLEFAIGGLLGLTQEDFEDTFGGRTRKSGDDGTIREFDFQGRFLQKKNYPGTVSARRYRSIQPRPFRPSLEVTTENYGLTWQYVSPKTPASFQFNRTEVTLDPRSDDEESGLQINSMLRFETAYRFNTHNILSFTFVRNEVEEQPFELIYDSNELTFKHRLDFGPSHFHRFDSEFVLFNQKGTFDVERIRWREALRLNHSESLRSWYIFEFLDRTQGTLAGVPPIEETSYSLSGTLEHKLYDSLVSQFNVFGQRQEFGTGLNIDRYAGQASFDYRKNNRWGVLRSNYRARFQQEDRQGGAQRVEVLDERHTFRDPEFVTLIGANIETGSIRITADDRVTSFQAGRDYSVRAVGDTIEIERLPMGTIQDGQEVLIDYVFTVGGDFMLETIDQSFFLRQDFNFGLSPYYRLRKQDQTITPAGALGVTPDDITAHTAGLEYREGPLTLQAEYEDHESTINPFDAIRLNAGYTRRFDSGARGSLKARWSKFNRLPPNDRDTRFFTVEARYRHPIKRTFAIEGSVLYRNENDSLNGNEEGVDFDLALEWKVRNTDIRVTYEYGKVDDPFTNNESSALFVQIRRKF